MTITSTKEARKIAMITTGSPTIADALAIVFIFAQELDIGGPSVRKKYIREKLSQ